MRGFARLAALALLTAGLPTSAAACGASPAFALIHSALPSPLPEGVFIAEVVIDESTVRHYLDNGVRAHVTKVIQGDPQASELLLRNDFITSCDSPLANGSTGLLLGLLRGQDGDDLILDPITVHRLDGFRLPDGFSVPVECREKRCMVGILPSPTPERRRQRR